MNARHTTPSNPRSGILTILADAGLLLILIGTAIPLFSHHMFEITRWIFTGGTVITLAARIAERFASPGDSAAGANMRLRRLLRIRIWAAVMFGVAAVFMFLRNVGPTDWVAFTLAGAALTCYTSIMIPRVTK